VGILIYQTFFNKSKCVKPKVNLDLQKDNPKVVHAFDIEDLGDKAVYCRCWRSKKVRTNLSKTYDKLWTIDCQNRETVKSEMWVLRPIFKSKFLLEKLKLYVTCWCHLKPTFMKLGEMFIMYNTCTPGFKGVLILNRSVSIPISIMRGAGRVQLPATGHLQSVIVFIYEN